MKHIACYSGGEASACVAVELVARFGPENVILMNHQINAEVEHEVILQYKLDIAAYLGIPITYASMPGWETMNQFDVCIKAKAFKVGVHPLCTNRLKTNPFHKWLKDAFPVDPITGEREDVIIYYGFEAEETERIERRTRILAAKGYKSDYPLATWPGVMTTTRDIGIDPPSTYDIWKHANCVGCLRAGKQHWYVTYCQRPDIWEQAKAAEVYIGYSIIKGVYLQDLESMFEQMKAIGIPQDEKTKAGTFWARVKKALKAT